MGCIKSKQEPYIEKIPPLDRLERLERRERLDRLEKNLYEQIYNQMIQYSLGVNPYYTNNQEKQKKTHHQKIIEKMRKDGVNINDYQKYSGLFYQCPFCSRQFSEDERPNLRNCGHFVCNNQFCYKQECVVPGCGQKSAIKLRNYWPWIVQTNKSDVTYNFVLNYRGINDTHQIKNISENKTISSIINMYPFARSYLEMIPKQHRMVTIGSNMLLYDEVKEMTIKSLTNSNDPKFKVKLMKSSAGVGLKNKISCCNLF